jgi:hypothetical protein
LSLEQYLQHGRCTDEAMTWLAQRSTFYVAWAMTCIWRYQVAFRGSRLGWTVYLASSDPSLLWKPLGCSKRMSTWGHPNSCMGVPAQKNALSLIPHICFSVGAAQQWRKIWKPERGRRCRWRTRWRWKPGHKHVRHDELVWRGDDQETSSRRWRARPSKKKKWIVELFVCYV